MSFSITPEGRERVKQVMQDKGWTREKLAEIAGEKLAETKKGRRETSEELVAAPDSEPEPSPLSEATIKRFFNCSPRKDFRFSRDTIEAIAQAVGLQPIEITDEWNDPPNSVRARRPGTNNEDYYIERFLRESINSSTGGRTIEAKFYKELLRCGALIRIKGPQFIGKTSLVNQVLSQVDKKTNYRKIRIAIDKEKLTDLESFLKWLCITASKKLELDNRIDDFWNTEYTPKDNITYYLQDYLLSEVSNATDPIILILEKFEHVLEYPQIFEEFCDLLRGWSQLHITGDNDDIQKKWQRLRLVVIYATEIYGAQDINHSPLNTGTEIQLPEFTSEQVLQLAQRYRLNWEEVQTKNLMNLVGGHPYLVHRAIHEIAAGDVTLDRFLQEAHTENGSYRTYLRKLLSDLKRSPELYSKFKEIVTSDSRPLLVDSFQVFRLKALGLIKVDSSPEGDLVAPLCRLYQKFFHNHFAIESEANSPSSES